MKRVYNFSAGPSVLPEAVLNEAAAEMLDYRGCGTSVMEMSHRSAAFQAIIDDAERGLRELMKIPPNYHVLFLQGGASLQFAMVPLNLLAPTAKADYIHTGAWSGKAIAEARLYGDIRVAASSEAHHFTAIPELEGVAFREDAAYVHITSNNTIHGTRFHQFPDTGVLPLVADMSSEILSAPVEVSKFGLIYAGAQKNAGPAGVTIAIVRDDLVGREMPNTPTMLRYGTAVKHRSLFNTPPCYAIYILGKVVRHLLDSGGLDAAHKRNLAKADLLYNYLDQSQLFKATVASPHRSIMNIPFLLPEEAMTRAFLSKAEGEGLVNLRGHRSVGGMRASIYNAMPLAGVAALVDLMTRFEVSHKKRAP